MPQSAPSGRRRADCGPPRFGLRILSGKARGVHVALDAPRFVVGRGPGADLAFDVPGLARQSLVIETQEGGRLEARTLWPEETFGVQGRSTPRAVLSEGDVLELGPIRLQVERAPSKPGLAESGAARS